MKLCILLLLVLSSAAFADTVVVKKALFSGALLAGADLLQNGNLATVSVGQFAHWGRWGAGYDIDAEVHHSGRYSARCANASAAEERGLAYRLELDQRSPLPIRVECWSKAQDVSGGEDSGYSLYLDLEYADGTPLWGQTAAFDPGTHDWQRRVVTVMPSKPVRSVSIYGILRRHTGTVWFDDFRAWSLQPSETMDEFDAIPVEGPRVEGRRRATPGGSALPEVRERLTTPDGFALALSGDGALVTTETGGFLLRDAAAGSDFVRPRGQVRRDGDALRWQATAESLKLRLSATYRVTGNAIRIDGVVRDLCGKDRAVTVYFVYPIAAIGWDWFDDQRSARRIEAGQKYQSFVRTGAGANGFASRYPLACIAGPGNAMAMAVPLDVPRLVRFGYDASSQEMYAAVDLGLSEETARFPSSASFSLVLYRSDPAWGFRSALERCYQLFPQCFAKRNAKEGIWMPFSDIEKVRGWEDFGFQFKEGDSNVAFDSAHGIYSFVYVEPWSNWMTMPPEVPRTPDDAIALLRKRAAEGSEEGQATLTSVMQKADGQWCVRIEKQPWCDGAVIGVNPSPGVPAESGYRTQYQDLWRRIDGAFERSPQLTGVYHDSFEMYLFHNQLNYRREHFRETTIPLVFDSQGRVCQYAMFSMVEFAREVAQRMWARGGLTFANGTPHSFPWGAAWLDVMGTEAAWASSWGKSGEYRPEADDDFNYWRAMCYQRPYLMLLNTRFELWKPEWFELYMKRCTAYGVFPSMFSYNASQDPYWERPELYDRDRPLFKKYIPVVKALSAAGWEPVTHARSDNPKVYVERFGRPGGPLYFTVLNDSDTDQEATVSFDTSPAGLTEVLSGERLAAPAGRLSLQIGPQDVKVIRVE